MGMYRSGALSVRRQQEEGGGARTPLYLAFKNLIPFVNKHLGEVHAEPLMYRTATGNVAHGIDAEVIPLICSVWLDARKAAAAVTSLRIAGDIAKGLVSLHTMAEVQAKAIELNQSIIEAQHRIFEANAAQTALVERVRDLESQVARMKDWDAQKQRYKLKHPQNAGLVYALQKAMSNGEPPHYICTSCFERGERSILQEVLPKDDDRRLFRAHGHTRH